MKRSIGVTLSALLVFFGCAMALLGGALMALTFRMGPAELLSSPLMRAGLVFDIVLDLAFVGWGVATGLGLVRLRPWARISMLVFSGIMIFFCLLPMAIVPFVPIPQPEDSPGNVSLLIHAGIVIFYGCFVALGAFWIYFFNRRNVKAQFKRIPTPGSVAGFSAQVPDAGPSKPTPIIVLAILLIVGSCFAPLVFVLHTPVFFFGFAMHARSGEIFLLAFSVASLVAGIGMLGLRAWSWALTLLLQTVGVINAACFLLVPGALERFNTAMAVQEAAMGLPVASPGFSLVVLMRVSLGFGVALGVAILWMLVAYRKAFHPPAVPAAV